MLDVQPSSIAFFLTLLGCLMVACVLASQASARIGVPVLLAFLVLGMAMGQHGLGVMSSRNYGLSYDFSMVALVLILFDGGLNTPADKIPLGLRPALMLSTAGVLLTALMVAGFAWLFSFPPMQSLLLGAIVSSTDAAAVFSILRNSQVYLKKRVGMILELESGLNDPMAFILTIAFTESLVTGHPLTISTALWIPVSLAGGALVGFGVGWTGRALLARINPPAGGLFPVLTLAFALVSFGFASLLALSGFLAVYVSACIIGNGPLPYGPAIRRVHDSAAWLGQLFMFLLLGLLATPSSVLKGLSEGMAIAGFLVFAARPITVLLCLAPFRYPLRETGYIGLVGLRGAVPIILATYPVMVGAAGAHRIFDVVFVTVVVNTLLGGVMTGVLAKWLGVASDEPVPPPAVLEMLSPRLLGGCQLDSFAIAASSPACGAAISDLPLPEDCTVMLLIRDEEVLAPRGGTLMAPGDHVYVLHKPEDAPFVRLIFGRPEA
jgi:potassium/hydrogen antiporter